MIQQKPGNRGMCLGETVSMVPSQASRFFLLRFDSPHIIHIFSGPQLSCTTSVQQLFVKLASVTMESKECFVMECNSSATCEHSYLPLLCPIRTSKLQKYCDEVLQTVTLCNFQNMSRVFNNSKGCYIYLCKF